MKKNLTYELLESVTYVNSQGLVTFKDQRICFTRKGVTHEARKVEIWEEKKKKTVLQ